MVVVAVDAVPGRVATIARSRTREAGRGQGAGPTDATGLLRAANEATQKVPQGLVPGTGTRRSAW